MHLTDKEQKKYPSEAMEDDWEEDEKLTEHKSWYKLKQTQNLKPKIKNFNPLKKP